MLLLLLERKRYIGGVEREKAMPGCLSTVGPSGGYLPCEFWRGMIGAESYRL